VEGLYRNWGTLCPLEEVVALKEEFCYRLILDDSHAIGTMGETGRGSLERCGLLPMVHCEILTFSIENAFGSVGGMTVGSEGQFQSASVVSCILLFPSLLFG
jgi:serine palmitoyltransferase